MPNSIKLNRFSSSGIGNFPMSNGTMREPHQLPPFSPTPTTGQNVNANINHFTRKQCHNTGMTSNSPTLIIQASEIDAPTEMVEQTNDQFVEFDLGLNNQDQYDSCGESGGDEESAISENIVTASLQSNLEG